MVSNVPHLKKGIAFWAVTFVVAVWLLPDFLSIGVEESLCIQDDVLCKTLHWTY